jgi:serine/threonine-protein kinase
MATTYRATSPTGNIVALKILSPRHARNRTSRRRFENEVALGISLNHPNIVRVIDYGLYEEMPYIVMDYIAGDSLDRRIRAQPITPEQLLPILIDVAVALDHANFAHKPQVIHRDVKPANILLRSDGRAMLADFGIAKLEGMTSFTATDARVGSVYYMSPEQAGGALELTPASDVYSLGVSAFHALTGRQPFTGDHEVSIARMQIDNPPPHLCELNPAITPAVCSTVLWAMEKSPSKRPSSAGEFAEAFRMALSQSKRDFIGDRYHAVLSPSVKNGSRSRSANESVPSQKTDRVSTLPMPQHGANGGYNNHRENGHAPQNDANSTVEPTDRKTKPQDSAKAQPTAAKKRSPLVLWALGGIATLCLALGLGGVISMRMIGNWLLNATATTTVATLVPIIFDPFATVAPTEIILPSTTPTAGNINTPNTVTLTLPSNNNTPTPEPTKAILITPRVRPTLPPVRVPTRIPPRRPVPTRTPTRVVTVTQAPPSSSPTVIPPSATSRPITGTPIIRNTMTSLPIPAQTTRPGGSAPNAPTATRVVVINTPPIILPSPRPAPSPTKVN